jgi:hypothetical protein
MAVVSSIKRTRTGLIKPANSFTSPDISVVADGNMSASNPSTARSTPGFKRDGTPKAPRKKLSQKEQNAISQESNQDDDSKVMEQVRRRGTHCESTQLT